MHWAKASNGEFADPPVFGELPEPVVEPPEPVDDGLLHAVASRAMTATAMMAAAVRAADGRQEIGFMPAVLRPGG
jgi:hypothetical protein